jgi:microcystin-dependent protein
MSDPYIGEIRMFAGNFAPAGWAFCDGSLQSIAENSTLFNLIGTTYGGDGINTFALPDLRSRVPIHLGSNGVNTYVIGQSGGVEQVTLTVGQLPTHNHAPALASTATTGSSSPAGDVWANGPGIKQFSPVANANGTMATTTIPLQGGSQPHDNMLPFLAVSYIIALFGVYPSQN